LSGKSGIFVLLCVIFVLVMYFYVQSYCKVRLREMKQIDHLFDSIIFKVMEDKFLLNSNIVTSVFEQEVSAEDSKFSLMVSLSQKEQFKIIPNLQRDVCNSIDLQL
jgi:hypothetical protein